MPNIPIGHAYGAVLIHKIQTLPIDKILRSINELLKLIPKTKEFYRDMLTTKNNCGKTALHLAVDSNSKEVVEKIIELISYAQGTNIINFQDNCGNTALHYAVTYALKTGTSNIFNLLLKVEGVNLDTQNSSQETISHLIAWSNNLKILKLILPYKPDLNIKNYLGKTPLHYASNQKNLEFIKKLIESGAKPSILDNQGKKALSVDKEDREEYTQAVLKLMKIVPTDPTDIETIPLLKHSSDQLSKYSSITPLSSCSGCSGSSDSLHSSKLSTTTYDDPIWPPPPSDLELLALSGDIPT